MLIYDVDVMCCIGDIMIVCVRGVILSHVVLLAICIMLTMLVLRSSLLVLWLSQPCFVTVNVAVITTVIRITTMINDDIVYVGVAFVTVCVSCCCV